MTKSKKKYSKVTVDQRLSLMSAQAAPGANPILHENFDLKINKPESTDDKQKPRYPCLICDEDHFTKECTHKEEVYKFVKGSPTPAVLKDPFPIQDSRMIGSSSTPLEDNLMVATRSQDYGSKSHVTGKEVENSNSSQAASTSVFDLLYIKKPNPDLVIKPSPKGVLCK